MRDDNTRNTIIFFVSAALLLMVYQFFVIEPQAKQRPTAAAVAAATQAPAGPGLAAPQVPQAMTRDAAIGASPRVPIETAALKGSLSLRGGRIDDLYLVGYRQTLDKGPGCLTVPRYGPTHDPGVEAR
jgi:YidC/Oxa1 family membrane protein insertase